MVASLSRVLNIQPGEGRPAGWLFLHSFLFGITSAAFNTAAYTLFLTHFSPGVMPVFYIVCAGIISATGIVFNRASGWLPAARLAWITTGAAAASILILWVALAFGQPGWLIFLLLIWNWVIWTLNGLVFWGIAGRLFTLQQGKRLFGLVGSGELVSGILTGFAIPSLINVIGTINLFALAGVSFVGVTALTLRGVRVFEAQLASPATYFPPPEASGVRARAERGQMSYILIILALASVAIFGFYLLDFIFYDALSLTITDEARLAGFLAIFLSITKLVSLTVRVLFSGRILSQYGLRTGLLSMPVLLASGLVLSAISGGAAATTTVFFILIVGTKAVDEVLRYTLDYPAYMILFQPIPTAQRGQALSLSEGVISPLAGGLAGVVLIALADLLGFSTPMIVIFATFALIVWVIVAVLASRRYSGALSTALDTRVLDAVTVPEVDSASLDALRLKVSGSRPGEVFYALGLIEQADPAEARAALITLVRHRNTDIVIETLKWIEERNIVEAAEPVAKRLAGEGAPRIRAAGLRALGRVGGAGVVPDIMQNLDSALPDVRTGALAGLLLTGAPSARQLAEERLATFGKSRNPLDRFVAARTVGEAGLPGYPGPLATLLMDHDETVRRAAINAAPHVNHETLWPLVIRNLSIPPYSAAAASALSEGGESLLPLISATFDYANTTPHVRALLARAVRQIGGPKSQDFLLSRTNHIDRDTRLGVIRALAESGFRASGREQPTRVMEHLMAEAQDGVWLASAMHDLQKDENILLPLFRSLRRELSLVRQRALMLVAMLSDIQTIRRVLDNLDHEEAERRAYALELLDTVLPQETKSLILPLAGGHIDALIRAAGSPPEKSVLERLRVLISPEASWLNPYTTSCAIYAARRLDLKELGDDIARHVYSPDVGLAETALWALHNADPERAHKLSKTRDNMGSATLKMTIATLDSGLRKGDLAMLLTVEKVSILKTVSIFADIPDEVLAKLSQVLQSVEVASGETFIHQGEPGDSLYVIVDGRVQVHAGDEVLAELEERDIVGEMAVLDPGPRSASVTALADSRLLRVDRNLLFELMQDHVEVIHAVIKVLTQRLRSAADLLQQSGAKITEKNRKLFEQVNSVTTITPKAKSKKKK